MTTVLIVEDHQIVTDGLKSGLAQEPDMSVVGATSTLAGATAMIETLDPEVVLLDLHLPDGIGPKTLVKTIRAKSRGKIIVFSAELRMPVVQMILGLGVSAYLLKSESIKKVVETIRSVMGGETRIVSTDLSSDLPQFSKAEEHLLRLLSHGFKYQDIADRRQTAPATVRKQVELLLLKLNCSSREELIAWAVENGFNALGIEEVS